MCGALAYVLIILYDSQEIDDNIKDHVETEFVSDGNVSETHEPTITGIPPPILATGRKIRMLLKIFHNYSTPTLSLFTNLTEAILMGHKLWPI